MPTYIVTCPECGRKNKTRWIWADELPPGGVAPVECDCGYMILSESEGNPRLAFRREES